MNRNQLEVTILLDELVYDKVIKYLKKKGTTRASAFEEFTNKVLEQKINYIENQTDTANRLFQEKKGRFSKFSKLIKEREREREKKKNTTTTKEEWEKIDQAVRTDSEIK
jgi:ribosomal protein L16 Arg81 hydroxylase